MAAKKNTRLIPRACSARILVSSGAKRVSANAANAFSEVLEVYGEEVSKRASRIAGHAGRKTVIDTDVKIAVK